jgi:hypothetical protein
MRTIVFLVSALAILLNGPPPGSTNRKDAVAEVLMYGQDSSREQDCRLASNAYIPNEEQTSGKTWFVGCGGIY